MMAAEASHGRSRGMGLRWLVVIGLFVLGPVMADSSSEVVERYMAAYNDHDVAGMLELVQPDVQWLTIDGDTARLETDGASDLAEALGGYFEAVPSSRSRIDWMKTAGTRVSVRECAGWQSDGDWREQCALSVYEISGGRIARVWYFPAEDGETP